MKPLAMRAGTQTELARAEARLRSARALVLEEAADAWSSAEGAQEIPVARRTGLRLAATHATEAAAEVVSAMYHAGGGSSIYDSCALQRRFRDVHVATQHMMVSPASWELAGRILLAEKTDSQLFGSG